MLRASLSRAFSVVTTTAIVGGALAGAGACIDFVPATNQFDPNAPALQQAPARLTGRAAFPDGRAPAGIRVTVVDLSAGKTVPAVVTNAEDEGAFHFDVAPGLYQARAEADLFGAVLTSPIEL